MTKKLAVLFAAASGLAVGNLYWAQPLLAQIAASFGMQTHQGGLLITSTQIGYAIGILLIVPMGDILRRRRLIPTAMLCCTASLVICALAPSYTTLLAALLLVGLFTVSGQIIVPLTGDLAKPEERGFMVGIVVSGITTGILVSRVLSGFIAVLWGWRAVYLVAAALNLIMAAAIVRTLPEVPSKEKISYGRLIRDVLTSVGRYPVLPQILLPAGFVFGVANMLFWTALTFLLSDAPFHYSTLQIGLLSLVGLAGALGGIGLGKLQDKGLGIPALGAFIALTMVCMAVAILSGRSVIAIAAIGAVISLAIQGVVVLSQTRIFSLSSLERSRLNTVFVFNNFVFAAIGSALASVLWKAGDWTAVCIAGVIASAVGLIIWFFSRKSNTNFN